MNYKLINIILVTVIGTVLGLAFIGWAVEDTEPRTPTTTNTTKPVDDSRLTNAEYSAYMDGCTGEGASWDDCDCTVDYLETFYGRKEILRLTENPYSQESMSAITASVEWCLGMESF